MWPIIEEHKRHIGAGAVLMASLPASFCRLEEARNFFCPLHFVYPAIWQVRSYHMTGRVYSLHVNRLVSTSLILNEGIKYKSKVQKDFISYSWINLQGEGLRREQLTYEWKGENVCLKEERRERESYSRNINKWKKNPQSTFSTLSPKNYVHIVIILIGNKT